MNLSAYTVHAFHLWAYSPQSVWVGVSWFSPEDRLQQHLTGQHSSPTVRRGRPRLAPELYEELPEFDSRDDAEQAADRLAEELSADGFDVRCDPDRLNRISAFDWKEPA